MGRKKQNVHHVINYLNYDRLPKLFIVCSIFIFMNSQNVETIYDRVEKLEDEVAVLRNEVDVLKKALRNKIARHEVSLIKKGKDVVSIID